LEKGLNLEKFKTIKGLKPGENFNPREDLNLRGFLSELKLRV